MISIALALYSIPFFSFALLDNVNISSLDGVLVFSISSIVSGNGLPIVSGMQKITTKPAISERLPNGMIIAHVPNSST